jgi:hypothetical protein
MAWAGQREAKREGERAPRGGCKLLVELTLCPGSRAAPRDRVDASWLDVGVNDNNEGIQLALQCDTGDSALTRRVYFFAAVASRGNM